jgi:transcriptional regulator with PAS, ATPase and Fis domain
MEYHWPGNVRELGNVIERCVILRQGPVLRPSLLLGADTANLSSPAPEDQESDAIITLAELEKGHIRRALDKLAGNHTRTAKALGISRSTLKRKIRAYDLA